MLTLVRKTGERIVIGEGEGRVVITLVDSHPGRARIGIDAPKWLSVHREEVYDKIQDAKAGD